VLGVSQDKLDYIGRNTRHFCKHKAFGGIQLLVTGDFSQLPPVTKKRELEFAFEAQCWAQCFDLQVELTKVFRQADSQTFVDILNEVRRGVLSDRAAELLSQRVNATVAGCSQDGIIATRLYPYRVSSRVHRPISVCACIVTAADKRHARVARRRERGAGLVNLLLYSWKLLLTCTVGGLVVIFFFFFFIYIFIYIYFSLNARWTLPRRTTSGCWSCRGRSSHTMRWTGRRTTLRCSCWSTRAPRRGSC